MSGASRCGPGCTGGACRAPPPVKEAAAEDGADGLAELAHEAGLATGTFTDFVAKAGDDTAGLNLELLPAKIGSVAEAADGGSASVHSDREEKDSGDIGSDLEADDGGTASAHSDREGKRDGAKSRTALVASGPASELVRGTCTVLA